MWNTLEYLHTQMWLADMTEDPLETQRPSGPAARGQIGNLWPYRTTCLVGQILQNVTVKKTQVLSWQYWGKPAKINDTSLEITGADFIFHLPLYDITFLSLTLHLTEKIHQLACKYHFCQHPYRGLGGRLKACLQLIIFSKSVPIPNKSKGKLIILGELHWDTIF